MFFGKVDFRGRARWPTRSSTSIGDRTGRIVPIYPQSRQARRLHLGDRRLGRGGAASAPASFVEPLPASVLDRLDFVDRTAAFHGIHLPESMARGEAARRRLVFDELLRIQLALVLRKRALERDRRGIAPRRSTASWSRRFLAALPFDLTGAQRRAIAEIDADLAGPHPMHRLLQGDVGAGKTVVAVAALLTAVQGGHQGAFMAPTEVLAEQHAAGMRALLDGLDRARRRRQPVRRASAHGGAAHQPRHRRGAAQRCSPALADGEVDLAHRHPRPDPGGGRVPQPRRGGHRRAAPVRRRAAGRAAGRRPPATPCPTCWS